MGTVIYEKYGLQVKRFYGGDKRGVCYQITLGKAYVQLTTKQYVELLSRLVEVQLNRLFDRLA